MVESPDSLCRSWPACRLPVSPKSVKNANVTWLTIGMRYSTFDVSCVSPPIVTSR